MANSPVMNATRDPIKSGEPKLERNNSCLTSNTFLSPAPINIGIDNRKLNLTDSSCVNPPNKPPEIVAPDLEIPGTNARH